MKKADVIIGANFGDEGKGLITDFLSARAGGDAVVVRFNGGAQAGHTVTTDDGRRHVFSHFGSGSFAGASTYLSRFFVCNPLLFVREYGTLKKKSVTPVVCVDENSPVTTPYDMMINQMVEEMRGAKRHGSCGVGFGETLERVEKSPRVILYKNLKDKGFLKETLRSIARDWVPARLSALGIETVPDVWKDRLYSAGVEGKFMDDSGFMLDHSRSVSGIPQGKVVFEGAQGLLLDQDSGYFPHVTRSHTGLKNVVTLAKESGITALDATYITRAYMTRHGAGPLAHELQEPPYKKIEDATNVVNPYQGHLRFGWLDADLLARTIYNDMRHADPALAIRKGLAVTCLDQVDEEVSFVDGDIKCEKKGSFPDYLKEKVGADFLFASYGPTRKDVSG